MIARRSFGCFGRAWASSLLLGNAAGVLAAGERQGRDPGEVRHRGPRRWCDQYPADARRGGRVSPSARASAPRGRPCRTIQSHCSTSWPALLDPDRNSRSMRCALRTAGLARLLDGTRPAGDGLPGRAAAEVERPMSQSRRPSPRSTRRPIHGADPRPRSSGRRPPPRPLSRSHHPALGSVFCPVPRRSCGQRGHGPGRQTYLWDVRTASSLAARGAGIGASRPWPGLGGGRMLDPWCGGFRGGAVCRPGSPTPMPTTCATWRPGCALHLAVQRTWIIGFDTETASPGSTRRRDTATSASDVFARPAACCRFRWQAARDPGEGAAADAATAAVVQEMIGAGACAAVLHRQRRCRAVGPGRIEGPTRRPAERAGLAALYRALMTAESLDAWSREAASSTAPSPRTRLLGLLAALRPNQSIRHRGRARGPRPVRRCSPLTPEGAPKSRSTWRSSAARIRGLEDNCAAWRRLSQR